MLNKKIKVGFIGFGNIGQKRYKSLSNIKTVKVEVAYIVDLKKPKNIEKKIKTFKNWKDIRAFKVDLIIVSTPTNQSKIIVNSLCNKFNILVEKPLSNNLNEIKKITLKSVKNKKLLKIGYNLRFDDGLIKSKEIVSKKLIGKIYYIKITYANGAAKTNSNKVGSLLDMGTHSINLADWILNKNKLKTVNHMHQKNEFLNKTKVDNGFILLKSKNIPVFIHHGFCTWKNKFSLEISGSKGYVRVNSLSKWKNQEVSFGIRKFPDGVPRVEKWFFKIDNSWKNEIMFVLNQILKSKNNYKSINFEGVNTIKIIKKLL